MTSTAATYRTVLLGLIKKRRLKIVEVGVHKGRTSQFLLENRPLISLVMVDPWTPYSEATEEQQATFKAEAYRRTNKFSDRRTIIELPSTEAAKTVGKADLVFIDAEHTFEACLLDCRAWWPVVNHGGILCGHDFGKGLGIDQAVYRWAAETWSKIELLEGNIWMTQKP